MLWNVLTHRGKRVLILKYVRKRSGRFQRFPSRDFFVYINACEARDDTQKIDDDRETNTRETHKAKRVALRKSRIWGER